MEAAKNRGDADEFKEVAEEDVEVIPKRENFEEDASDSEEIFVWVTVTVIYNHQPEVSGFISNFFQPRKCAVMSLF